ncbi:MAG: cell division topological specificity factor MinE [Candidatus Gastranaerophilaceae bacterium]
MKEIFTDLYRKLAGFFQAPPEKENLKEVACNRLKLVLMQDRTNLTPFLLERMRGEMIDVLSKYVEMDKEALELSFEQEGEQMALMLSIPVLRAKDEAELQALIKAEEEAKVKAEKEKTAGKTGTGKKSKKSSEEAAKGPKKKKSRKKKQ